MSSEPDLGWVHFGEAEARALAFELHSAGVDIEALLEQIEAFPCDDVSRQWCASIDA